MEVLLQEPKMERSDSSSKLEKMQIISSLLLGIQFFILIQLKMENGFLQHSKDI